MLVSVGVGISFLDDGSTSGINVSASFPASDSTVGDGFPHAAVNDSSVSVLGRAVFPSSIDEVEDRRSWDEKSSNKELALDREPDGDERSHVEADDTVLMLALLPEKVEVSLTTDCNCLPDLNCGVDSGGCDAEVEPAGLGSRAANTLPSPLCTPSRMPSSMSLPIFVGTSDREVEGKPLLTIRSHLRLRRSRSASCCASCVRSSRHFDSFCAIKRKRSACLANRASANIVMWC